MRPDPLLMGAYYRRRGEDRVTEVLATVLDGTPAYIARLADRVGLPRAAKYEVETQVPAPGCIADLQINALASNGDPAWLLWSEHKVHAPFSRAQLTKLA